MKINPNDYIKLFNIEESKKVSAIVANIGGFTSHSAIVAREFGIPCVVGASNATLVFKDNDKILVDANKRVVKKL